MKKISLLAFLLLAGCAGKSRTYIPPEEQENFSGQAYWMGHLDSSEERFGPGWAYQEGRFSVDSGSGYWQERKPASKRR